MGVQKREPSYTIGGNVNWYTTTTELPQKTKKSLHMIQQSHSWAYIQTKL